MAWCFVRRGIFMTSVRYRLQVEPVLSVIADVAAFGLLEAFARRRPEPTALPAPALG